MMGLRIAALRRAAGWSQAELAQRLKISPSAVGMYEQGRREPAVNMLVELSREFGVSIDYLVTGQPDTPRDTERFSHALETAVDTAEQVLGKRRELPFTQQELTVLFAALLLQP